MRSFTDILAPRGEALQIVLKRRGKPVGGIYADDTREVRSPSLDQELNDAPKPVQRP